MFYKLWRQSEHYKYAEKHDSKDWGWEFIRRDPHYRAEWKREFDRLYLPDAEADFESPLWNAPDVSTYPLRESARAPLKNVDFYHDKLSILIPSVNATKWGLRFYANPTMAKLRKEAFLSVKSLYICQEYAGYKQVTVENELHTLVTIIDVKKPLAPQIEAISSMAKEKQQELKKANPKSVVLKAEKVSITDRKRWTAYIRFLDAKEDRAKRSEAANILFPKADPTPEIKWDDTSKQIKELSRRNYAQFMG